MIVSIPEFAPALRISDYLQPGEAVNLEIGTTPDMVTIDRQAGSIYYPIEDRTGHVGNSVFAAMPKPGDYIAPVEITGNVRLHVHAVSGAGSLVIRRAGTDYIDVVPLRTDETSPKTVTLLIGDEYGYVNNSNESFVLRDDCVPAFRESDEQPSQNSILATLITTMAIEAAITGQAPTA